MTRLASRTQLHFKDAVLDELAQSANVAQFVSFGPGNPAMQRFARIHRHPANAPFPSTEGAIAALLDASPEHSVNIRAFDPAQPKSNEFLYGLRNPADVVAEIGRLGRRGFYTIVNETIDVNDGGVSGVSYGGVVEFAPDDTPRAVEKPGTAAIPRAQALALLETVYGFRPKLDHPDDVRAEFSVHPLRRGLEHDHTIIWEVERVGPADLTAPLRWPNLFSRMLGDKAYGLLIAHTFGLPVPATIVISRRLAPFCFGRPTGNAEIWIRTCPVEPVPGRFTTSRGWLDPFALLAAEDPEGTAISSVLAQHGINAAYSGALGTTADLEVTNQGVVGFGDRFMAGAQPPATLPPEVDRAVHEVFEQLVEQLGPVRFEWVYDGETVWIVQLHVGATASHGRTIYPGAPRREHPFRVPDGLEALRALADQLTGTGDGIVLLGDVGLTSHFGDVLRRAQIPSRMAGADEIPAAIHGQF
jgi:hypothetical protein